MKEYKIVKATKKHLKYIYGIMQKRWGLSKSDAHDESSKYVVNNKDNVAWVVVFRDKPVGMGIYDHKNEDVSKKYSPWIFLLWVEPKHRGQGIGIKLTKKIMNHAKKLGHKVIYLDTIDALQYHLKLGWEKIEDANYHGEKTIIMKYELNKRFPLKK